MNLDFYWKLADDFTEALKKLPPISYDLNKVGMGSAFALIVESCKTEIDRVAADDLAEHILAKIDELGESFKEKAEGEN